MPKIVTEEEKQQVRESIYINTLALIQEKGIKKITVDDIVLAVGISKGSFYNYYPSREVAIYEILKRSERRLFSQMEEIMKSDLQDKDNLIRFFNDVFLSPENMLWYVSSVDLDILLRKLPAEYRTREDLKSDDYFTRSLKLMKVSKKQMETVALLTDCIGLIIANTKFSEKGKRETLDIIINATADYIVGRTK
ncbi:MAG: TetR/AcrR family transcriptional regulator [Coprobacillaceae bacterium]